MYRGTPSYGQELHKEVRETLKVAVSTTRGRLPEDASQEQVCDESRQTIDLLLSSPTFQELLTTITARRVAYQIKSEKSVEKKQKKERDRVAQLGAIRSEAYQGKLQNHPRCNDRISTLGMTSGTNDALTIEFGTVPTIEQLARMSEEQVSVIRNIGETRLSEIRAYLRSVGLDLSWVDEDETRLAPDVSGEIEGSSEEQRG